MSPVTPPGGSGLGSFNLSEWALHHRSIVVYLIVVFAVMGGWAYTQLGQSEDPPFTFKIMVVKTHWAGASTREVEQQVTDKIERKLQELPLEWVRSYSKPGESLVFVAFRDALPSKAIPELQYQARKKIGDIRGTLPQGIQGPYFNDEFGDTYTNIYAITGDGFGYRELDDFADRIRAELLRVPGVAKVDKIAAQDEKIFIEIVEQQARHARRRACPDPAVARGAERRGRLPARSRHPPIAFTSARREPSIRSRRSAISRSARTTASSGSATSRTSVAATSIRRSSRFAGVAAKRSAWASRWRPGAT